MIKIGLDKGQWLLITDGNNVYISEDDVRYYSKPPDKSNKRRGYHRASDSGANRIYEPSFSPSEFDSYCDSNGFKIKHYVTQFEELKRIAVLAAIGGFVGAEIAGLKGAAIVAIITGWSGSHSSYKKKRVEAVFNRVASACKEWQAFDARSSISDEDRRQKDNIQKSIYLTKAKGRWHRYYKLKLLSSLDSLSGFEFESAVASLYESKGYITKITKSSGDYGVDVLATKGNENLAIQAKRYSGNVGIRAVQEVSSGASYYKANKAIVVTNSFFTQQAKTLAKRIDVTLIDKRTLAEMWGTYFPSAEIPPFDLEQYERMKPNIDRELYRTKKASGGH